MADQVRKKEATQYWPPEGTLTFQRISSPFSSISFAISGDRKNPYGDAIIAIKPAKACMQLRKKVSMPEILFFTDAAEKINPKTQNILPLISTMLSFNSLFWVW